MLMKHLILPLYPSYTRLIYIFFPWFAYLNSIKSLSKITNIWNLLLPPCSQGQFHEILEGKETDLLRNSFVVYYDLNLNLADES